ncbi:MAG: AI-2E family transporter [Halobacteriales archaeon]|nr:AI-2E family transporter [Halobacteriales archaeon]
MNQPRAFLLVAVAVSAALSLFVLLPLVQYVFAAVLLAYVLRPIKLRLEPHFGTKVACYVSIWLTILVVVVPVVIVSFVVAQDVIELARSVEETQIDVTVVEELVFEYTGQEVDVPSTIATVTESVARGALGQVSQIFGFAVRLTLGVLLLVFLLYYLLKDGEKFVVWSKDVIPLPDDITDELYTRLGNVTQSVVYGHLLVAVAQALLAGAGLAVAGVPNYLFWTLVMVFFGVLPIIGVFVVWGPAALYLVATGSTTAGIALAVYGATVVSVTDNYLRSILVDRDTGLNPGVVLVGVLGGIYAMGVIGLFVGPVIIGSLKATLNVYRERYDEL